MSATMVESPLACPPAPAGSAALGSTGVPWAVGPAQRGQRRPGVLLDRDGTIIRDLGYVGSVERVELIAGAADAIRRLNVAGIPVAVVSNQAGVARGLFSIGDVEKVHRCIERQLAHHGARVDRFFFCPYHPDGVVAAFARSSEDRKPRPGMAFAAAEALGLDLEESWVVGDRREDVGLAAAVGAHAVYVGPGPSPSRGVPRRRNLSDAATLVLERLLA